MKISELIGEFEIFTTNEERRMLSKLSSPAYLDSFSEREQVIIEGMIRKSLVIKIGSRNPKVVANEL
jgi:hypothetical protein